MSSLTIPTEPDTVTKEGYLTTRSIAESSEPHPKKRRSTSSSSSSDDVDEDIVGNGDKKTQPSVSIATAGKKSGEPNRQKRIERLANEVQVQW
jgi:hypothetical protein